MKSILPTIWTVYGAEGLTPETVQNNTFSGEGKLCAADAAGKVDAGSVFPGWKEHTPAGAILEFSAEEGQTLTIGICADFWFALFLNGEMLADFRKRGNGRASSIFGHPIRCRLKKGQNRFAVYLEAGSGGFSFTFGILPELSLPQEARQELVDYYCPEEHRLACAPFLTEPGSDRMTIGIAAKFRCGAVLHCREKGSREYRTFYDEAFGLSRFAYIHRFPLTGLKPDLAYEYQIDLYGSSLSLEKETFGPFFFRTWRDAPSGGRIFVIGDTQMTPELLTRSLKHFEDIVKQKKADLLVHLGDAQGAFSGNPGEYTASVLPPLRTVFPPELPLEFLRGNHENRGSDSLDFMSLFGAPYRMFSFGTLCCIKLDSGFDADAVYGKLPGAATQNYGWNNRQEPYMRRQRQWLEQALTSPEWKQAKFRLIFAHATPGYDFSSCMMENIRTLLWDLLIDGISTVLPDLWICGHTHQAGRFSPETQTYWQREEERATRFFSIPGRDIPFPVVILGGPRNGEKSCTLLEMTISDSLLHVSHYAENGKLFDAFEIRPNHLLRVLSTELHPLPQAFAGELGEAQS